MLEYLATFDLTNRDGREMFLSMERLEIYIRLARAMGMLSSNHPEEIDWKKGIVRVEEYLRLSWRH